MLRPRRASAPACRGAGCRRHWRPAAAARRPWAGCARRGRNSRRASAPSMISTESQPSLLEAARPAPWSWRRRACAVSSTTSLPSACLADSAVLSASRRTFFCRSNSWLRTTGPKMTRAAAELRRAQAALAGAAGALLLARASWSCRWMSLMPLVLCVPARRLASCQFTMRARMSLAHRQAEHLVGEIDLADRLVVEAGDLRASCLSPSASAGAPAPPRLQRRRERQVLRRLALRRVRDQHIAAVGAGHRALDHDQAALGIGRRRPADSAW